MGKRNRSGGSSAEGKKRRKEKAENWKNAPRDNRDNNSKSHNSNSYTSNRGNWGLATFANAENKRFNAFYQAQMPFLNPEGVDNDTESGCEFDELLKSLRLPLPACFRLSADFAFKDELRSQVVKYSGQKQSITTTENNVEVIEAVKQLQWYPNGCGYQLGADRRSIRKLDCLSELHEWMKLHTENGNITRQEAVSMVPPLALDVQPHHKCLDMCAAPGSKTSQLLEIINRSLEQTTDEERALGHGLVVANDSDTDRAYMLVHQCRRINSPLLVVTTHKGQGFPSIYNATPCTPFAKIDYKGNEFFDRVLCDVPCSGDGTLRKNPAIWEKWSTYGGATLHPLQLMIAQRGLQMLKPGGLMTYSTCSLSPYEDEAVIAELLRTNKGTLELVDARQFLPLFTARPGLSEWHVIEDYLAIKKEKDDKDKIKKAEKLAKRWEKKREEGTAGDDQGKPEAKEGEEGENAVEGAAGAETKDCTATAVVAEGPSDEMEVEKEEEEEEEPVIPMENLEHLPIHVRKCVEMGMSYYPDHTSVPEVLKGKYRRTMFSPSVEERGWMHLEKCMRCLPHDEDTGGFFVATLRKVLTPENAATSTATAAATTAIYIAIDTVVGVVGVANIVIMPTGSSNSYTSCFTVCIHLTVTTEGRDVVLLVRRLISASAISAATRATIKPEIFINRHSVGVEYVSTSRNLAFTSLNGS